MPILETQEKKESQHRLLQIFSLLYFIGKIKNFSLINYPIKLNHSMFCKELTEMMIV